MLREHWVGRWGIQLLGLEKCEVQDALHGGEPGVYSAVFSCIPEIRMSWEHEAVPAVCCGEVSFRSPRCCMEIIS